MRIRSVGHACLEIETNGQRILTDPWWAGPAYTNQWYPWPTPMPDGVEAREIDYVYLSHGHEDHLHPQTLKTLRPGSIALVPRLLTGGMADYLREGFGFSQVIELEHARTTLLRGGIRATCYVNLTDSILVLEGEQVMVDGNDALHASSPEVIDHFCQLVRKRHPRIDTLFLGYGGASWFPNCMRIPGKDDRALARAREQTFVNNFLRVVDQLEPRLSCAFAASFVLLEPHNRWINEVKLEVSTPDQEYARRRTKAPGRCHLLLPNDRIDGGTFVPGGGQRPTLESFQHACTTTFSEACQSLERLHMVSEEKLDRLVRRLDERVRTNRSRLGRLEQFSVEIWLRDRPGIALYVETGLRGSRAFLGPVASSSAVLELRSEILEAALNDPYGIEAMVIGYGATLRLDSQAELKKIRRLLRLITPRDPGLSTVASDLRRSPWEVLSSLWAQRWPLAIQAAARAGVWPKEVSSSPRSSPLPALSPAPAEGRSTSPAPRP